MDKFRVILEIDGNNRHFGDYYDKEEALEIQDKAEHYYRMMGHSVKVISPANNS